jgi:hypothetical protein
MAGTKKRITKKDVAKLQAIVARDLLAGRIPFPDMAFLRRHPLVFVDAENVAGQMSLEGARVLPRASILAEAQSQDGVAYLHFQPPVVSGDEVELTLQGKLAAGSRTAGLSTVQVKYRKVGDRWERAGDPVSSSA